MAAIKLSLLIFAYPMFLLFDLPTAVFSAGGLFLYYKRIRRRANQLVTLKSRHLGTQTAASGPEHAWKPADIRPAYCITN
jgi:hypothetical protein